MRSTHVNYPPKSSFLESETIMFWVFIGHDGPNGVALRLQHRPEHLDYLVSFGERVQFSGPLLDDDGVTPIGSLIIIEAADRADATALFAADPYAKVFASTTLTPMRKVFPVAPGEKPQ